MEKADIYTTAVELLEKHIKEHNMRSTPERLIILRHLSNFNRHFTADMAIRDICEQEHISIATIYNNLALFCDANILRILPPRQQQGAEYEFTLGEKNALRYICTQCGRVKEFKNKAVERLLMDRKFSNFDMESFTLNVYGHCKTCRGKKKKR